ncbi:MAG: SH3 domain-containing protein [Cypionkella sp.]|jgi:uncharacterized protein YgiM (DUF1202 family)|nr:SH3 domain-containing protein [Cypionkella sp.]
MTRAILISFLRRGMVVMLACLMLALPDTARAQDIALSRAGQPDQWVITGIQRGETLALRILPGTMFDATGSVQLGETVRNFGCAEVFGARWCKIGKLAAPRAEGFVRSRYLTDRPTRPTPDDSLSGGPDFWQVTGLSATDRLNIRDVPSANGRVLGTLRNGERAQNMGCLMQGQARWCKIRALSGNRTTGFVNARYLREAASTAPPPRPPAGDDLAGGPDFWRVRGLPPGDRLNVRQAPSARSPILATLGEGERVRNLGCEMSGNTRWCLIRSTTGVDVTGYVAARYLRE